MPNTSTQGLLEKRLERWIVLAFLLTGFTIGMFAGASASPVGGSLLSGLFGFVAGFFLLWFTRKKDDVAITIDQKTLLAKGVVWLCTTSILGVFVGWQLRDASLWRSWNATQLLSISKFANKTNLEISASDHTKVLLIQKSLADQGIPNEDNNTAIGKLLESVARGDQAIASSSTKVTTLRKYLERAILFRARLESVLDSINKVEAGEFGKLSFPDKRQSELLAEFIASLKKLKLDLRNSNVVLEIDNEDEKTALRAI